MNPLSMSLRTIYNSFLTESSSLCFCSLRCWSSVRKSLLSTSYRKNCIGYGFSNNVSSKSALSGYKRSLVVLNKGSNPWWLQLSMAWVTNKGGKEIECYDQRTQKEKATLGILSFHSRIWDFNRNSFHVSSLPGYVINPIKKKNYVPAGTLKPKELHQYKLESVKRKWDQAKQINHIT